MIKPVINILRVVLFSIPFLVFISLGVLFGVLAIGVDKTISVFDDVSIAARKEKL